MAPSKRETGADTEIWQNVTAGTVVLRKIDAIGRVTDELVAGGAKVTLTPAERHLNEEEMPDPAINPWALGILQPVRVADETAAALAENPNIISDDAMRKLIAGHLSTLKAALRQATSTVVVERFHRLAIDMDERKSVIDTIAARLEELRPLPTFASSVTDERAR